MIINKNTILFKEFLVFSMRYGKIMLIVCISLIALFSVSGVFANDATNETTGVNDLV